MSETKLLPCPFCGSNHIVREQMKFKDSNAENMLHEDGTKKWTYIKCARCGCSTEAYCYEYQSTKKWNTRKPMERIVERLEEMYKYNSEQADLYRDGDSAYMRDKKEMYMDRTNCFGAAIRTIKEVGGFCD